jgi:hypothetical protein
MSARAEQSQRVVAWLDDNIKSWLKKTREGPFGPNHFTHLNILEAILRGHLTKLSEFTRSLSEKTPLAELHEQARLADATAAWIGQLWDYYRSRFDQRSNDEYRATLNAADEVIWSCYSELVPAGKTIPLAFIDDQPRVTAIFQSGVLPAEVIPDQGVAELIDYIQKLPIPLIGLSPVVVSAPWWLALIGHEIGHHLHNDELCLNDFRQYLTAKANTISKTAATRWEKWASEIFADWYSVLAMGQWAVISLAEQVWDVPRELCGSAAAGYPPSIVRFEFMTRLTSACGLPVESVPKTYKWESVIAEWNVEDRQKNELREDWKVIELLEKDVKDSGEYFHLRSARDRLVRPLLVHDKNADPIQPRSEFLRRRHTPEALKSDETLQKPFAARMMCAAAVKSW